VAITAHLSPAEYAIVADDIDDVRGIGDAFHAFVIVTGRDWFINHSYKVPSLLTRVRRTPKAET
jgi:hypothetical protein